MNRKYCLLLSFILIFLSACTVRKEPMPAELLELRGDYGLPLAKISLDKGPVWLELKREGPTLITSPLAASLQPFKAWTEAIHAVQLLPHRNMPVFIVNGRGFLSLFTDKAGELYLMGDSYPDYLAGYTIGPSFLFNGRPSFLLYRDFFYRDSKEPPPMLRFFSLALGAICEEPPLLSRHPYHEGWEINSLATTADGALILRAIQQEKGKLSYLRGATWQETGEEVAQAQWLSALKPESIVSAQNLLKNLLYMASADLNAKEILLIHTVSPDFPAPRVWALSGQPSIHDPQLLMFEDMEGENAHAWIAGERTLLLREGGKAYYIAGEERFAFSLPPLPAQYFWTSVALVGESKTIVASWEEREDWRIGAAGIYIGKIEK